MHRKIFSKLKKKRGQTDLPAENSKARKQRIPLGASLSRIWGRVSSIVSRGYRVIFILSFCFALFMQALVFLRIQSARIEKIFVDDFAVALIAAQGLSDAEIADTLRKISALYEVSRVRFVPPEESMKMISKEEPHLAGKLSLFGVNPAPAFFELKLEISAVSDLGVWLENNIRPLETVAGVSYNPEQVNAILQTGFYRRFIEVVLALGGFGIAFLAFIIEVGAAARRRRVPSLRRAAGCVFSGLLGGALGAAVCWQFILPSKFLTPVWWSNLSLGWFSAIVLCCGLIGWSLFRWKNIR